MTAATHRTIVETSRFQQERGDIEPSVARWDEVMIGVLWALCRETVRAGQTTGVDGIFALPTDDWPGAPALVIYYTFDDNTVTLRSVILAPSLPI